MQWTIILPNNDLGIDLILQERRNRKMALLLSVGSGRWVGYFGTDKVLWFGGFGLELRGIYGR